MALTNKQQRFVDEYLVDLNATQAALRAGYSPKSAEDIGRQLLRKTPVALAIAEHQRARAERTGITADRVLAEVARLAFYDIRKVVNWRSNTSQIGEDPDTGEPTLRSFNEVALIDSDKIDDDAAASISEMSQTKDGALKVKLHDKKGPLELLMRHLGLLKEKIEVTGKDGGPIETKDVSARDILARRIAGLAKRNGPDSGAGSAE